MSDHGRRPLPYGTELWGLPLSSFCSGVSSNYFSLSYICRSNNRDIERAFGPHQMLYVLILEWGHSSQKKKTKPMDLFWSYPGIFTIAVYMLVVEFFRVSSLLKQMFCQRCSKCSVNECKELISCLLQTGKAPSKPGGIKRQYFWIVIEKLTSLWTITRGCLAMLLC